MSGSILGCFLNCGITIGFLCSRLLGAFVFEVIIQVIVQLSLCMFGILLVVGIQLGVQVLLASRFGVPSASAPSAATAPASSAACIPLSCEPSEDRLTVHLALRLVSVYEPQTGKNEQIEAACNGVLTCFSNSRDQVLLMGCKPIQQPFVPLC